VRGTFGSSRPAEHEREMLNKLGNIGSCDGNLNGGTLTTKTSVLEKQRTITPTSFVNVMPLQNYMAETIFQ